MTRQWITIFAGPFPKALALQATLEAQGIRTFLADETTKVMDPFITGANSLSVELRVSEQDRAEVEAFLATFADSEAPEPSEAEREAEDALRLARLLRWCLVFAPVGWIVGAWLGWEYRKAARRLPSLPAGHGATIAFWCLEIFLLVACLAIFSAM
jgi:hypothetical protein